MPTTSQTPTPAHRAQAEDYLQQFAQFLEGAERSPVTIKNYLCDLNSFRQW